MATQDDLAKEYQLWCLNNNLPQESAEELLIGPTSLTLTQITYLTDFIRRWEKYND